MYRCQISGSQMKGDLSLTAAQVFLNIVLDEAVEEKEGGEKVRLGMIVRISSAEALRFYTD